MNMRRLKEMVHDLIETKTQATGDHFVLTRFRGLAKDLRPTHWHDSTSGERALMAEQMRGLTLRLINEAAQNREPLFGFVVAPVIEAAFAYEDRLKCVEPLILGTVVDKNAPENYARSYVMNIGRKGSHPYVGLYLSRHQNGALAAEYIDLQRQKGNGLSRKADERAEGWGSQNLLNAESFKHALAAK